MDSNFQLRPVEAWDERGTSHSSLSPSSLEKFLPSPTAPRAPQATRSPLSFDIFQDPVDRYNDKPLPPPPLRRRSSVDVLMRPSGGPRKPSSVYSNSPGNVDMHEPDHGEDLLPPHIYLQPATYRVSTSEIPCSKPLKATTERSALMRGHSEMVPPKQRRPDDLQDIGAIRDTYDNRDIRTPRSKTRIKEANEHAEDYRAILPTRSSIMPTFNTNPTYFNHDSMPDPLSPRIIDVIDQSLMPPPLSFRSSSSTDLSRATSQFSSSSSNSSPRASLRVRAKKALHITKPSLTMPSLPRYPSTVHRRLSSYASDGSHSMQQSLTQMYDTLTTLHPSKPSKSPKPSRSSKPTSPRSNPKTSIEVLRRRASLHHSRTHTYNTTTQTKPSKPTLLRSITTPERSQSTKSAHIPREMRSPAIPITAYQHLGKKAWEPLPKSPRPKLARKTTDYFSLGKGKSPTKGRFGTPGEEKGFMSRFGGKGKGKEKEGRKEGDKGDGMTKDEKRREELKKIIVVMGLGRHV